jgi:hypothetical protein
VREGEEVRSFFIASDKAKTIFQVKCEEASTAIAKEMSSTTKIISQPQLASATSRMSSSEPYSAEEKRRTWASRRGATTTRPTATPAPRPTPPAPPPRGPTNAWHVELPDGTTCLLHAPVRPTTTTTLLFLPRKKA